MPQIMQWVYRMFLLYHGRVVGYKAGFSAWGGLIERYEIVGHNHGARITLDLTIDRDTGAIDGRMEQSRDIVPIYELGRDEPVEYLSRVNWKHFGDDLDGQEYKKAI